VKVTLKERTLQGTSLGRKIKCYKCQGYWHAAANCPSPIRVVIGKLHVTKSESDSEEFIYQTEESEDHDSDEEITYDNVEESNTFESSGGYSSDYRVY